MRMQIGVFLTNVNTIAVQLVLDVKRFRFAIALHGHHVESNADRLPEVAFVFRGKVAVNASLDFVAFGSNLDGFGDRHGRVFMDDNVAMIRKDAFLAERGEGRGDQQDQEWNKA